MILGLELEKEWQPKLRVTHLAKSQPGKLTRKPSLTASEFIETEEILRDLFRRIFLTFLGSELPKKVFFNIISFLVSEAFLVFTVLTRPLNNQKWSMALDFDTAGVVQRLVQRPSKPWMRVRFPSPALIGILPGTHGSMIPWQSSENAFPAKHFSSTTRLIEYSLGIHWAFWINRPGNPELEIRQHDR